MKKTHICKKVLRKAFTENDTAYAAFPLMSVVVEQNSKKTNGNTAFNQRVTIVADADKALIDLLQIPQTFKLTTDQGATIVLGDADYKLRLLATEGEVSPVKLVFERNSPNAAF